MKWSGGRGVQLWFAKEYAVAIRREGEGQVSRPVECESIVVGGFSSATWCEVVGVGSSQGVGSDWLAGR